MGNLTKRVLTPRMPFVHTLTIRTEPAKVLALVNLAKLPWQAVHCEKDAGCGGPVRGVPSYTGEEEGEALRTPNLDVKMVFAGVALARRPHRQITNLLISFAVLALVMAVGIG